MREPAQHAQAIVDADDNHAVSCEPAAVIKRLSARASYQCSSIYPEKDRRIMRIFGRPDVEREAIFAHGHRVSRVDIGELWLWLEASWTEIGGVSDAVPSRHVGGRFPAQRAYRRCCKRDAFEDAQI